MASKVSFGGKTISELVETKRDLGKIISLIVLLHSDWLIQSANMQLVHQDIPTILSLRAVKNTLNYLFCTLFIL